MKHNAHLRWRENLRLGKKSTKQGQNKQVINKMNDVNRCGSEHNEAAVHTLLQSMLKVGASVLSVSTTTIRASAVQSRLGACESLLAEIHILVLSVPWHTVDQRKQTSKH